MNIKTAKIALDIIMTMLFALLMEVPVTGIFWHELLGLLIFGLFAAHKILNWNWIKGVSHVFLSAKCKSITRIMYFLDALLLISICGTTISGILISQSILPFLASQNATLWFALHSSFAYGSMILISVHLGMHWKSIMSVFRIMFSLRSESRPRTLALRTIAAILVAFGIRNSLSNDLSDKLLAPLSLTSGKSDTAAADTVKTSDVLSNGKLSSGITRVSASTTSSAGSMTLEEYLGKLVCTACSKHCPLLSPRCGKGVVQAQLATQKYNSSVKSSSGSSSSTQNSTTNNNSNSKQNNADSTKNNASQSNKVQSSNAQNNDAASYTTATAIVYVHDINGVLGAFADVIPMMTIYVAGTYYALKIIENKNYMQE